MQRWIQLGRTCFQITEHMPDETNGINSAVTCYKEVVQFSAFFVTSLFASFLNEICETATNFVLFPQQN